MIASIGTKLYFNQTKKSLVFSSKMAALPAPAFVDLGQAGSVSLFARAGCLIGLQTGLFLDFIKTKKVEAVLIAWLLFCWLRIYDHCLAGWYFCGFLVEIYTFRGYNNICWCHVGGFWESRIRVCARMCHDHDSWVLDYLFDYYR